MQIKKRLRINAIATVITAVVIILMLLFGLFRVNRAVEASGIADRIIAAGFERVAFRNDYIRTNSERAKTEWRAKHEQIGKLLQEAAAHFRAAEDRKNIDELLKGNESISKFFAAIVANREKTGVRPDQAGLSQEVENRLISHLNMLVYEAILHGRSLQESSDKALLSALKFAGGGIICVLAIVVAAAVYSSWTMNRAIRARVERLRDGTAVIGGGDLDHRIDIRGDDEFVEIAEAFNEMAARLRGSYHALEQQVKERTRAEESLQKTHDELELRIAERTKELSEVHEMANAERQRLYAVLETLPVYVVLMTRDHHVPFANRFFRERFGESGGRRCYEYLFNRSEPCEICESFSILKTNAPHHWEWTGPDGRNYDIYDFPFTDSDGSGIILEMGIDITEQKQAEKALEEVNETLEHRIDERTIELQAVNAKLFDSRRAALNMMEDADTARRRAEEISADLLREIVERKRAEEELRHARDELDLRVTDRTKELALTVETLLEEMAEREKAEGRLQRLNRLYAVLSETDQAIVRAVDKESLFRDFCRISVEQGGFILSWIGLVDEESGGVNVVAACGATAYLDEIRITTSEEPAGAGPTGISIREGTYFICNDFLNEPCASPWHERGLAHGICASASVALKEEGRVIGALTLYAGVKDFFDQQHVDLLRQMGTDISFALDNFNREERRREAEQALREETLERLRAVEALREKEQLLLQQSRLAAMGEMINNIAHQWRQPLNVLGLNIQRNMLFYELGDFNGEFLQASTDDAMKLIRHMSQTIDDFRNFFKTDKEKTLFSVNKAVQWTISLLNDGLKSDHIEIVTQNNGDPHINGYFNEFCQALLNIVQNARDVLVERKIAAGTVSIVSTVENNRTIVTITDNGGGVPEEILNRIYEPYFSTKGIQGTGIGLFMSKTIIETNMAGRITVRNTDQGAEFRIEI